MGVVFIVFGASKTNGNTFGSLGPQEMNPVIGQESKLLQILNMGIVFYWHVRKTTERDMVGIINSAQAEYNSFTCF